MGHVSEMELTVRGEEAERSFEAILEKLENPNAALRRFGKYLAERLKKRMEAKGDGTWPGYAESTLKRMSETGIGRITKFGKIRKGYLNKLASYEKFLQIKSRKEKSTQGYVSEGTQKKLDAVETKVKKLRGQIDKLKQKDFSKRKVRKAHLEKMEMLGKLNRLSVRVEKSLLRVGLLSGPEWAWRHNEGDGSIPRRQIVPEELDANDMDVLIKMLEDDLAEAFEHPEAGAR